LGAFLGFISALLTQYIWNTSNDRIQRRSLKIALKTEATSNLSSIRHKGLSQSTSAAFVELYDTAVWEAAIATDKIRLITDADLAATVARMYARIDAARKWDLLQVQLLVQGTYNEGLFDMLSENVTVARRSVLSAIEDFLKKVT